MKVVIDRIEDGIATVELENGKMINVPAELFDGCKEGDIVYITPNVQETEKKKQEVLIDISGLFDN
ncbi:MAG: DUF3006 domain-containing protein [Ruminococcaceae bacterium]|nr:DUF3006 domain-containing protein [Oscillospiraceae bacterium]